MTNLTKQYPRFKRWLMLPLFILGVMLVAPAANAAPAGDGCGATLSIGSRGPCVVKAQTALRNAGYNLGSGGADGSFGPATRSAVLAFQKANGVEQRGWIGPNTWAKLNGVVTPVAATTPASLDHLVGKTAAKSVFIVDKSDRRLYMFQGGSLIDTIEVRTGGVAYDPKVGWVKKDTPIGKYWVQAKVEKGYSTLYDADMPYFVVFNGNIGTHYSANFASTGYWVPAEARSVGTVRGSHGCVNIKDLNKAKKVFDTAVVGHTRVFVQE